MAMTFDSFLRLTPKKKAIWVAVIIAIIAVLYGYLGYRPLYSEMRSEEMREAKLLGEEKQVVANERKRDRLDKEIGELNARLQVAMQKLPERREIPGLLESVSKAGRDAGVEFLLFRPRKEEFEDFYAKVPVDVQVRGTYHNVARFFEGVASLRRVVHMVNLGMAEPKLTNGSVLVKASAVAMTFRFLDEAEIKRIAEEKKAAERARRRGAGGGRAD